MVKSERLEAIKSLVPYGARLLDIGSDHGLLPYGLLESGHIPRAFVTDVKKSPLERSKAQLAPFGELVDFALSDGFKNVPEGVYDAAAVCGMGGELIARIIAEGVNKAKCPLILQPNSMQHKLRAYLWDAGYVIEKELYPEEGRHTYLAMYASYTGVPTPYTAEEAYLGKLRPPTKGYQSYVKTVLAAAEKRAYGAALRGNGEAAEGERRLIAAAAAILRA